MLEVERSLSTALEPVAPADALTRRTFGWYLALSFLIASANGLSTAALSFVSMATKVLFKSSKIVTTMLLGVLCFGKVSTHGLQPMSGTARLLIQRSSPLVGSSTRAPSTRTCCSWWAG